MTNSKPQAVVIGASAGGIDALSKILPALPRNYSLPIIVVVHLPTNKNSIIAELFQSKCLLKVKEAEDKEPICAGTVYFAPPDYHLLIENDKRLSLSNEEPVQFSRPSIDVLFECAADVFASELIGVILTGANDDGSSGLREITDQGGLAIVQSPSTAQSSTMPEAALRNCPQALIMSLEEISTFLLKQTGPI